jgi:plasmid stabilization system protein ParE
VRWRVILHPEIENDLAEAGNWYETQQSGLGRDFAREVAEVLRSLAQNPYLNASRSRLRDVRWRMAKRYPYRVVYEVRESERLVKVVSVQHGARRDRQWRRRL